ncbi:MAG: glycerophosphodiester phosphodiesterase family protein [Caldilineaceae bacterium]
MRGRCPLSRQCIISGRTQGNTTTALGPSRPGPAIRSHRPDQRNLHRRACCRQTTRIWRTPSRPWKLRSLGADVVEFDVHRTSDDQFAVFHDWTLDCRTDGTGVTRDQTLADLQTLDIGYGYTGDGAARIRSVARASV